MNSSASTKSFLITINQILRGMHSMSSIAMIFQSISSQFLPKICLTSRFRTADIHTQFVASEPHGFGPNLQVLPCGRFGPNQKSAGLAVATTFHSAIGGTPFIYMKCSDSQVFPHTQSTVFVWIDWSFF